MDNQNNNRQVVYIAPPPGMTWCDSRDDRIDLLTLWNVIWQQKFFIIGVTLAATIAAAYVTFFVLPVTYQSKTVLLPADANSGQMGGLASLASSLPIPISVPGASGSGSQLIMAFLESQNFKVKLIEKYDLLPRLYKKQWDPVKKSWLGDTPNDNPTPIRALQRNKLNDIYVVSKDKKTELISITWVDEDPAFAAKMLDRVIADLNYYLVNDYESDAKRERKFVEKQLASATSALEFWEQQVPGDALSLTKIKRELMAATTVYTELRKQLELAKLTEEKEVVNFKVVDPPFVPEVKFKPKRLLICALTMVTAGFLTLFVVFAHASIARLGKK